MLKETRDITGKSITGTGMVMGMTTAVGVMATADKTRVIIARQRIIV